MNPQQTTAHAHSGTSLQHHNKESPCPTESYPLGISRHHFHNDKDKSPLMTNRATCRCGIVELKNTEAYAATKRIPWLFATNPQQEQAHALSESCLTHIPPTSPRQQADARIESNPACLVPAPSASQQNTALTPICLVASGNEASLCASFT